MNEVIDVHNFGIVRLDGHDANDLSVVNAARVSFGKRKTDIDAADEGLVKFLMRERHGTPFEHNSFRFHIRCPIFVAREWFRHRIGSFNEFSARYAEVPTNAYMPKPDDFRSQVGKPGSYSFEKLSEQVALDAQTQISLAYSQAFDSYRNMLSMGVAKELARMVLPMGSYTEFYWTLNARSLMNFLSLRTHPTAMAEIRDYAAAVEEFFKELMPVTWAAWEANNRVAP
jgi:thymidylate synthase (FAD)